MTPAEKRYRLTELLRSRWEPMLRARGFSSYQLPLVSPADAQPMDTSGRELRVSGPSVSDARLRGRLSLALYRRFTQEYSGEALPKRLYAIGQTARLGVDRGYVEHNYSNVEIVGGGDVTSVAECILTSAEELRLAGVTNARVDISDLRVVGSLLAGGLEDAAPLTPRVADRVVSAIPEFADETRAQAYIDKLAAEVSPEKLERLRDIEALGKLDDPQLLELIEEVLDSLDLKTSRKRPLDEIATVLSHKLRFAADIEQMRGYLPALREIVSLSGDAEKVIPELRKRWPGSQAPSCIDEMEQLASVLAAQLPPGFGVQIDLSMPRFMRSYASFIFNWSLDGTDAAEYFCRGGVYDELIYLPGSLQSLPVVGFALNVDDLIALVEAGLAQPEWESERARPLPIVPADADAVTAAFDLRTALLAKGVSCHVAPAGSDQSAPLVEVSGAGATLLDDAGNRTEVTADSDAGVFGVNSDA